MSALTYLVLTSLALAAGTSPDTTTPPKITPPPTTTVVTTEPSTTPPPATTVPVDPCNSAKVNFGDSDQEEYTIYSPGYPDNYPNSLKCNWTITALPTHFIDIHVNYIDLQSESDYLIISDIDPDGTTDYIATLSGSGGKDIEFITDSNVAYIQFVSDPAVNASGFSITLRATIGSRKCNKDSLQWSDGYVFSGGYTWVNPVCSWLITTGDDTHVGVSIENFAASYPDHYLVFYDGASNNDSVLFQTDGTKVEHAVSFFASTNQILVEITGEEESVAVDFAYFFFTLTDDPAENCSYTYDANSAASGQITSAYYPNNYPAGVGCQWQVQGDVTLVFDVITLAAGDVLTIYDADQVVKVCDDNSKCAENDVILAANSARLVFNSKDSDELETGYFKLKYYLTNDELTYETSDTAGWVMSPNYPSNYPTFSSNYYYISVATGDNIYFYFPSFSTEQGIDLLTIYDGDSTSAEIIASLSGSHSGYSGTTTGLSMTMYFSSDYSVQDSGFMMTYSAQISQRVYTDYAEITIDDEYDYTLLGSPGVPQVYPTDQGIVWYFSCTFNAYRMDFNFFRIDIDETDFVSVYNGRGTSKSDLVSTIVGNKYYSYVYAVVYNTEATIWHYSDSAFTGEGFVVEYWAWSR